MVSLLDGILAAAAAKQMAVLAMAEVRQETAGLAAVAAIMAAALAETIVHK